MNELLCSLKPALVVLAVVAGSGVVVVAQSARTTAAPARGRAHPRASGTPAKATDAAGFLQRWLVLEPIRVAGQLTDSAVQAAVKKEYFPNQLTAIPRDGDTVTVGDAPLTWHAVDTIGTTSISITSPTRWEKPTSNVLFWAVTVVNAPREMSGVRLAIGSNAASIWWVNGEEVIGIYNDRQAVIDDGVSKRLTLKKGPNVDPRRHRQCGRSDGLLRAVSRRGEQSGQGACRQVWIRRGRPRIASLKRLSLIGGLVTMNRRGIVKSMLGALAAAAGVVGLAPTARAQTSTSGFTLKWTSIPRASGRC